MTEAITISITAQINTVMMGMMFPYIVFPYRYTMRSVRSVPRPPNLRFNRTPFTTPEVSRLLRRGPKNRKRKSVKLPPWTRRRRQTVFPFNLNTSEIVVYLNKVLRRELIVDAFACV